MELCAGLDALCEMQMWLSIVRNADALISFWWIAIAGSVLLWQELGFAGSQRKLHNPPYHESGPLCGFHSSSHHSSNRFASSSVKLFTSRGCVGARKFHIFIDEASLSHSDFHEWIRFTSGACVGEWEYRLRLFAVPHLATADSATYQTGKLTKVSASTTCLLWTVHCPDYVSLIDAAAAADALPCGTVGRLSLMLWNFSSAPLLHFYLVRPALYAWWNVSRLMRLKLKLKPWKRQSDEMRGWVNRRVRSEKIAELSLEFQCFRLVFFRKHVSLSITNKRNCWLDNNTRFHS